MTVGFLKSYSLLVIRTCHKRGVHAMGGMAAQIPIKNDPDANNAAIAKVLHPPCSLAELTQNLMTIALLSRAYTGGLVVKAAFKQAPFAVHVRTA